MRPYLFRMAAILFSISLSTAFSLKKNTTLTYHFVFIGVASNESDITLTNTSGTKYTKWMLDNNHNYSCSFPGQEIPCAIDVDEKYTHIESAQTVLNVADPDGIGPKVAFPMTTEESIEIDCTQYYIVGTIEIPNQIDVFNNQLEE